MIESPSPADFDAILTLYRSSHLVEAEKLIVTLLDRYPNSEILCNLAGAVCSGLNKWEDAVFYYDKAVEIAPDYFEAFNNRGIALQSHGRIDEALSSFEQAIALNPGYATAHSNRGIALGKLNLLREALSSLDEAIRLDPTIAEAYNNKGNVLLSLGRPAEALLHFDKTLMVRPNLASAFVNRGNALMALERWQEAVASYDRGISLSPNDGLAFRNRGAALQKLKCLDEALESYRRAYQIAPHSTRDWAEVRYLEAKLCIWNDEEANPGIHDGMTGSAGVPPFSMLRFADDPRRQLECSRAWSEQYAMIAPAEIEPRQPSEKIRIGYFSADFHNHATMYLMARLFEMHDKNRFEIHAFSYGPNVQDEMRMRLMSAVDAFHEVSHQDDEAVAQLARSLSIDIAVDLKGYTENARPAIFAYRAAPVQVQYLGYPGTMGAKFIDYIIADETIIPRECEQFYTESIIRLPNTYQINDDKRFISGIEFSRSDVKLPEKGFVFCCFNNNYKISRDEFEIWTRILKRVPGSVLWLIKDNENAACNLRNEAVRCGVAPERLVFAERMPLAEHLARHRCADLFLDTFNYNAHTTASDALWAGVPVVTKMGKSFAARVAGSLLHAVGLPELITQTREDYEALILKLANNPGQLAAIKTKLLSNLSTQPLFNSSQWTRDLETIFESLQISCNP